MLGRGRAAALGPRGRPGVLLRGAPEPGKGGTAWQRVQRAEKVGNPGTRQPGQLLPMVGMVKRDGQPSCSPDTPTLGAGG
jgi:hypothetical protein